MLYIQAVFTLLYLDIEEYIAIATYTNTERDRQRHTNTEYIETGECKSTRAHTYIPDLTLFYS